MNPLVWLVLDSCRHDSFAEAATPHFDAFAAANGTRVERRYSFASFTAPAHYACLMGRVPHANAPGVPAAEVYRTMYAAWATRLDVEGLDLARFLPHFWLPTVLRELGYRTRARVSLPVLNEATLLATGFDDWRLMDRHDDFAGMITELDFTPGPGRRSTFHFLNLGETHYPFLTAAGTLPRRSGLHGALAGPAGTAAEPASPADLRQLQVRAVERVDALFGQLVEKCPRGTHVIVTADHGELFGEDGHVGHGPMVHEKVFEVPFLEGRVG
jgi:arylsulfatase A-like enzyme